MEGPVQLVDNVIDAVIKQTGPAGFLLRRIEETLKYAYYRGLVGRTGDDDLAQTLKQWLDYRLQRLLVRVCGGAKGGLRTAASAAVSAL